MVNNVSGSGNAFSTYTTDYQNQKTCFAKVYIKYKLNYFMVLILASATESKKYKN